MKSTLYKKAAELFFTDPTTFYSCNAIYKISGFMHYEEEAAYQNLFAIDKMSTFRGMFNDLTGTEPSYEELREIRIYALLFAYEIFKAEKKSFAKSYYNKRR